jgi:hypothetical protein
MTFGVEGESRPHGRIIVRPGELGWGARRGRITGSDIEVGVLLIPEQTSGETSQQLP